MRTLSLPYFNRTKSILLVAGFFLSVLFTGGLFAQSVSAAPVDEMPLDKQIKSLLYYRAVGTCMQNSSLTDNGTAADRITSAHADTPQWFGYWQLNGLTPSSSKYYLGPYANKNAADIYCGSGLTNADGTQNSQTGMLKDAINTWGYKSGSDALCAFGFLRMDYNSPSQCTEAQGGGGKEFYRKGASESNKSFQTAVKNKVYGGKDAYMSDAAWYKFYYTVFSNTCGLGKMAGVPQASATGEYGYTIQQVGPDAEGKYKKTPLYVLGAKKKTETVDTRQSNATSTDKVQRTCEQIAKSIDDYSTAFLTYMVNNGANDTDASVTNPEKTDEATEGASTCAIEGVGWIICPATSFLASIADNAYTFLADNFLQVDTSTLSTESPTYKAWSSMRTIANLAFVIAFLFIIFSQLTGQGVSNYGIKKMIPRLVVAAILVNVSFLVCQIAVDLSNILGVSLRQVFISTGDTFNLPVPTSNDSGNWAGIAVIVLGSLGIAWSLGITVLIPFLLAAVVAFAMVFLILVVRQVLIILLIVIAPLAFVAFLLPNTEQWFTKWRKMFTGLLLVFPLIGLLFGAASLASMVITSTSYAGTQDASSTIGKIVAAGIIALPLFLLPTLLRKSIDAAGDMGQTIGKLGDRFGKNARDKTANSGVMKALDHRKQTRRAEVGAGIYTGRNPLKMGRSAINSRLNKSGAFNAVTGNYGTIRGAAINKLEDEETKLAEAAVQLEARSGKDVGTQFSEAIAKGNVVKAKAAQNILMKTGGSGVTAVRDKIAATDSTMGHEMRTALASNIAENHGQAAKQKANDLLKWSTGAPGTKLDDISRQASTWGSLSARELSDMPDAAFERAMKSGGVSATTLAALQSERMKENLSEGQRNAMNNQYKAPTVIEPAANREFNRSTIEAMGPDNVAAATQRRGGVAALNDGDIVSIINAHGGTPIGTEARQEAIKRNIIQDTPRRDPNTMPRP